VGYMVIVGKWRQPGGGLQPSSAGSRTPSRANAVADGAIDGDFTFCRQLGMPPGILCSVSCTECKGIRSYQTVCGVVLALSQYQHVNTVRRALDIRMESSAPNLSLLSSRGCGLARLCAGPPALSGEESCLVSDE